MTNYLQRRGPHGVRLHTGEPRSLKHTPPSKNPTHVPPNNQSCCMCVCFSNFKTVSEAAQDRLGLERQDSLCMLESIHTTYHFHVGYYLGICVHSRCLIPLQGLWGCQAEPLCHNRGPPWCHHKGGGGPDLSQLCMYRQRSVQRGQLVRLPH